MLMETYANWKIKKTDELYEMKEPMRCYKVMWRMRTRRAAPAQYLSAQ